MKNNSKGNAIEHKEHEWEEVDFDEVFTPRRLILALTAQHGQEVHYLGVKTTFLNGNLQEKIYVAQLESFIIKIEEHKCTSYQRPFTIYNKHQRREESQFHEVLTRASSVYISHGVDALIFGVYVNDLIVTRTKVEEIKEFKQ